MIGSIYYCIHKNNNRKCLTVICDTEYIPRKSAMLNNYNILYKREGTMKEHEIFQKMNLARRFMAYSYTSIRKLMEDEKLFCSTNELERIIKICEPKLKELLKFHKNKNSSFINVTQSINF